MAPLGRILAQIVVPIIATLARALPAAYAQAVQNAKKGGVDAAKSSSTSAAFGRNIMSKEEAMMVLNVQSSEELTAEIVEKVRGCCCCR
jgi:import inner membrane translocase subunit TIM16